MPGISDWLALPELTVPNTGHLELYVLRAAFLAASKSEFSAVGIKEPVMLDRERDLAVVGMVTIQSDAGPAWLRLPTALGAWAVECCAAARSGAKPFPSRVRFEQYGRAIKVTSIDMPGPDPISTLPCPEHLAVFIDESGNTGDAIVHAPSGAFHGQPSFALACVGESAEGTRLPGILDRLRQKHRGLGAELKGRAMKKRPTLAMDLLGMLYEEGVPILIELMDKWYYVATNIATYVCAKAPWFDLRAPLSREAANAISDLIVEQLGPPVMGAYSDFAQTPSATTLATFEATLLRALAESQTRAGDSQAKELVEMATAMTDDAFEAYRRVATHDSQAHEAFLPEPDRTRTGNPVAMLAHAPAFTNLYGRLNRYASDARSVVVVHDEQLHVDHVLRAYAKTLDSNVHADDLARLTGTAGPNWRFEPGKFSLRFEKSDLTPGIQVADVLASFCTQRLNEIIAGKSVSSHEVAGVLGSIRDQTNSVGINLVTTTRRRDAFYA